MSDDRSSIGTSLLIFLAGAAVGAAVVALTTPKSGPELRNDLGNAGRDLKERLERLRRQGDACSEERTDEA
ncbi:MAG: YtxH domain-containing protein [Firmicutes bacterium]|nr:YtxH domain-containing protein [Bacillota bacterium]